MAILGDSCYTDGHRKPLKNFFENRVRNGAARASIAETPKSYIKKVVELMLMLIDVLPAVTVAVALAADQKVAMVMVLIMVLMMLE